MEQDFQNKLEKLRRLRMELLRIHKLLVDFEREKHEREFGPVTSGGFLQLLLNDEKFSWLRVFSQLIVEIDEAFDLNDGMTPEMEQGFLQRIRGLFNFELADADFSEKYQNALQTNVDVLSKHTEIKQMLD